MPFDANGFRKPTRPPVLEFGLLLKDNFFLMCRECEDKSGLWIHMLRRTEHYTCDCHVGGTDIIVIPSFLSFDNTRDTRLNGGKAYGNIFALR